MRWPGRRLALIGLATALALTACGGDDDIADPPPPPDEDASAEELTDFTDEYAAWLEECSDDHSPAECAQEVAGDERYTEWTDQVGDTAEEETGDPTTAEVTAEDVQRWIDAWCSVDPGATRDGLVAAMGEPTSEGNESLSWDAFGYQFNAFVDLDGNIRQMDTNTVSLSPSEAAEIECDETRVAP